MSDPTAQTGLRERLGSLGYVVVGEVSAVDQAIRVAREKKADLVIMGTDGIGLKAAEQATGELRGDPRIPVVFIVAAAEAGERPTAGSAEPFRLLQEPFSDSELHTTIKAALLRDRMERQLAEAVTAAEGQRAFFSALLEANPDGILVVDAGLRVRVANRVLEGMLGVSAGAMPGKRLGEVIRCARAAARHGCGEGTACRECGLLSAVFAALAGSEAYRNRVRMQWSVDRTHRRAEFMVSARGIDFRQERLAVVILEDVTELVALRRQVPPGESFGGMVGRHPKILEVFDTINDVAAAKVPVLILGESGTGKELVARAVHAASPRAGAPFVPVNCGALPESLLESELFGHVRGAFTGAIREKKGRFELADGGTIFLDEIGDLTPLVQVKLLRVLQEGAFERVGGESTVRVDVRVVSATHKDLKEEVAAGRFREDLFYRLCVVPIILPPLRERREDIPLLAAKFLRRREGQESDAVSITDDALALLDSYPWPGNVRELQNALQFAAIKSRGGIIGTEHLPPSVRTGRVVGSALRKRGRLTRQGVEGALRATDGNRSLAARRLGVSRATLYRFFVKSGL